jgi:hypothetical protein
LGGVDVRRRPSNLSAGEATVRRHLPLLLVSLLALARPGAAQDLIVHEWLIRGPIPADTGRTGVLTDYLSGEATILPDVEDTVAAGGFVRWTADSLGGLNLNDVFTTAADWNVAYAHTYVYAPKERTVLLVMDSDDDLVALVNGQRVWANVVARGLGSGRSASCCGSWSGTVRAPMSG